MAKGEIHVQLIVDYGDDPKLSDVSRSARLLWVDALCLSKRLMTDGLVTEHQIVKLIYPERSAVASRLIAELVASEAFIEAPRGFLVSGFLKRNKSKAQILADRETAQEAADKGNHQRWHVVRKEPSPSCRFCIAEVSGTGSPPRSGTGSGPGSPPAIPPLSPETETETETETVADDRQGDRSTSRKKPKTDPPDFLPITDAMKRWAAEHTPDVDAAFEMAKMLDFHRSHGNRYSDWPAAWRNWMRGAKPAALPEQSGERQRRSDIDRMFG